MPTFLCDGLTVNMLAAWLWSVVVTDQSTYFKTACARFDWCLYCHNSLFPASTLIQPSSEAGICLSAYFILDLSKKNMVVIVYSLLGHISIYLSELLKDYPHQFCSSVLSSYDDDKSWFCPRERTLEELLLLGSIMFAPGTQRPKQPWQRRGDKYPKTYRKGKAMPLPPTAMGAMALI